MQVEKTTLPSIPVNRKTGRNDAIVTMVEKNTPGPTCFDERSIISSRSSSVRLGYFLSVFLLSIL